MITPEEAARDAIRPEVAANMGNRGKLALIKLWIRRSHELAKKTAVLARGNPIMETTCCVESIKQPGAFLRNTLICRRLESVHYSRINKGNLC